MILEWLTTIFFIIIGVAVFFVFYDIIKLWRLKKRYKPEDDRSKRYTNSSSANGGRGDKPTSPPGSDELSSLDSTTSNKQQPKDNSRQRSSFRKGFSRGQAIVASARYG